MTSRWRFCGWQSSNWPGNFRTSRQMRWIWACSCTTRRLCPSSSCWRRHRRHHGCSRVNTASVKTTRPSCWACPTHTSQDRSESSAAFWTTPLEPSPAVAPMSTLRRRLAAAAAAASLDQVSCPSFWCLFIQRLDKCIHSTRRAATNQLLVTCKVSGSTLVKTLLRIAVMTVWMEFPMGLEIPWDWG